jgi:hypothetical protein
MNDRQGTAGEHLTEKLKLEIRSKYNLKLTIIGPTACAMAMQLDLCKWVEEENCAIQRTERTK